MDNTYAKSVKYSKIFKIFFSMMLAVLLIIMGGCSVMKSEKEQVQQSMADYLKSKYGIEFEVGVPYMTGSMGTAHYQAKAHPKGQPEIEFLINGDNYDLRMNGKYDENYLKVKWSYQGKQEVEKKLREVYGEGADINISSYYLGMKNSYQYKDLDFAQVFEQSHGLGVIELHYEVFIGKDQFNKEVEAKMAYQILKPFVLDFGSSACSFSVTYIDKAFKQVYLDDENNGHHHGVGMLYQQKKLLNFVQTGHNPVVNSDRDLLSLYKY